MRRAALALLLLLAGPVGAVAQPAPPPAGRVTTHRVIHRVSESQRGANPNLPIVVQGTVRAADSGEPLAYTNIFVRDSEAGSLAMSGGEFWLRGLTAGRWTIQARYLSYEDGEYTLDLYPGDIVEIDFWLEVDPLEMETMLVRAERLLLNVQETGTARRVSGDQLDKLALDDVVEVVALQPGVTLEDNEIHIRGGRADDTAFMLDGVSVKDPLASGSYGVSFNADLINEIEVLTGGFSAEYGQAVSGLVNVSTKEGGEEFEGKLSYKSDDLAPEANYTNTDDLRLTLSGPNLLWDGLKASGLPLPGRQSFIVSGNGRLSDTYLPTESLTGPLRSPVVGGTFWSPRNQNDWSVLGKLTWELDPLRKLNYTYSYQQEISQGFFMPAEGFPRKFRNILDDYNVFTSQNILNQLNWRHVLGDELFYTLNFGRLFSRLHTNKNGNDDFTTYTGPVFNEIEYQAGDSTAVYRAGAFLGGDNDRWHDHYTESWTAKGDIAWRWGDAHRFKAGLEYNATQLQLIDLQGGLGLNTPGVLARSEDRFRVHPQVAAAYLQDQLTYQGLILNLGLRLDGWAPGPEVDRVMANPEDYLFIFDDTARSYQEGTYDVLGRRWKARLSPRVGVSFPVSQRDKFFFNYGHFSQWPRYNYVYAQLETDFATGLQLIGNPDLDPKVTVQYETGIQHEFDDLWSAGISFYSNDIYGYAQAVGMGTITIDPSQTPDPDDTRSVEVSPQRYFNSDAARSLGVELFVEKRTTRWLSGSMSVEMQRSTGTNSSADATFLSAQLEQGNPDYETESGIRNQPLLWDRPWSFTLNLDFRVPGNDRPEFFGWTLPSRWSANMLYRAWSGIRWTESLLGEDGSVNDNPERYSNIGPYRSSLDLKFSRWWDLGGRRRITAFVEARNVLDHQNWRRVNPWTGEPYYRGNWDGNIAVQRFNGIPQSTLSQAYAEDNLDPSHRTQPREFFAGMSFAW